MVNLLAWPPIIPDGVEITSGVSLSVCTLTSMITNYLASVLYEGSPTCQRENGHSSLVGSMENSTCVRRLHSCLAAIYDCPWDLTYGFSLSDSILCQPVLSGVTCCSYCA